MGVVGKGGDAVVGSGGYGGYGVGVLSYCVGSVASVVSIEDALRGRAIANLRALESSLPPSSAIKALVEPFIASTST